MQTWPMQIGVLWFGRPAASPYEEQVATYRKRVSQRWRAEDIPLRPAASGRGERAKVLASEAATIRRRLPRDWDLVNLREQGRALDSVGFARLLQERQVSGSAGIAFVIGSDLGLDQALDREARLILSLSSMTLPHLLARLLLWEQLFRATDILGSGRYHRD